MGKAFTKVTKSELKCKRDSAHKLPTHRVYVLMDAITQIDSPSNLHGETMIRIQA